MVTQKKEWVTLPRRDAEKGRLHGEMLEPEHERWTGIAWSSHRGTAAGRMSVGRGKKLWNNTDAQGLANNFIVVGREKNGSGNVANEALHK